MSLNKTEVESDDYAAERLAIARRRGREMLTPADKIQALALSGGGIRSATFCLGLVRALAKNGKLTRYDYLSTVSGGGYLGGMLGRLYDEHTPAQAVEQGLASDNTILLSWLRKNGRYLTPAGIEDLSLALTQILRSFFPALVLVTMTCLLVAALAFWLNRPYTCDPHCLHWQFHWAVLLPLTYAALLALGYWLFTHRQRLIVYLTLGSLSILMLFALVRLIPIDLLLGFSALCMAGMVCCLHKKSADISQLRLQLTHATCVCLLVALAVLLLWIVHQVGYALYHFYQRQGDGSLRYVLPPTLLALLRSLWEIKPLKRLIGTLAAKKKLYAVSLTHTGNLLGYVVMALALISIYAATISLMHELSAHGETWSVYFPVLPGIASALLLWLMCRKNVIIGFLNLSSLHNFYRARIERAWISVGNYHSATNATHFRFNAPPLSAREKGAMEGIKEVTAPMVGDDIEMKRYTPHRYGGPLHLITCCINQTVDDRSGVYNADRKGVALTIGPCGAETGMRKPEENTLLQTTRLSRWLAISGAAAATGMGSQTAPGLSFLLFLLGGRLGFWSQQLGHDRKRHSRASKNKLCYLFAEMFARFPGLSNDYWYLSDGGHFENTAVYPLLKRRVDTIVVADCGADPDFIFDDLENLVRKAKIDMAIDITFPVVTDPRFTSLEALKKTKTGAPLILATLHYPAVGIQPEKTGDLIIVKPHLLEEMSLATVGYAQRHSDFPQQTTGDQFFDEAQWEAYHQLGLMAGKAIP